MTSILRPPGLRALLLAALLNAALDRRAAALETGDPLMTLSGLSDQSVVVTWFGDEGVPYQLESSSDLTVWTTAGPAVTGTGNFINVTRPTGGQPRVFFRFRHAPADTLSAAFDPQTGVLNITGGDGDDLVVVSRDVGGTLRINGGAVPIPGGVPTVANTLLIQISGGAGNDQLSLDESNGALPKANLFGEAGDDTLTGGSGTDVLLGGTGSDSLFGKGGADSLLGGDDDDVIVGGDGDDIAQLGIGNDRFVWNPGDDTDTVEGGTGTDTTEVNGGNGDESFTITANGSRVRFDRINPAPFFLDIGACENLVLNANGGGDTLACTGDLASLIKITADGGPGDDSLLGSNGPDLLLGGDNNDFIDGQQGADVAFLGAGDDVFQWDPGDGSDSVEGQGGGDTLLFHASGASEIIDLSANGTRLRFTRNIGSIVMDLAGIETVQCHTLGGADTVTLNDLSATEVTAIDLHLAGLLGGSTGDAQPDSVVVHGTAGDETITATQTGLDLNILGLKAAVAISTGESDDAITINAQGGNDTVNASGITTLFALRIEGGTGSDTITGGSRADVLIGDDDADTLTGGPGNDLVLGGAGGDSFLWNPGDGSDTLEGQAGTDTLLFNGSAASETMDLSANGARLRLFRDVAAITMDCNELENLQIHALAGADTLTIGSLTGTHASEVLVNLGSTGSTADGQADSLIVNGTQGNDAIAVAGSPGTVAVTGLSALVTVTNADPAIDSLTVNALAGADGVEATGLAANTIILSLIGGLGEDELIGSQGGDSLNGGDGNDGVYGGEGNDTLTWNPGDDNDSFDGQAGDDTLQFNGANVTENINLSANGTRSRFTRDIASVVMDCVEVEGVRFEAGGGADVITVDDLSATDVTAVSLHLNAFGTGTGDGQADTVIINGTAFTDVVAVTANAGTVNVLGLAASIALTGSEAANDHLTINSLAGDDVVDASALAAGFIALTIDGGNDHDVLTGSGGIDILLGGAGDDVLRGGPGIDVLDGGTGDNILIQD